MKRLIGIAAVGGAIAFAALSVEAGQAAGRDLGAAALSAKDAGAPAEPSALFAKDGGVESLALLAKDGGVESLALFAKDAGTPAPECAGNAKDGGVSMGKEAGLAGF